MASLDTDVDMVPAGEESSSGSAGPSSLAPSTSSKKPKRFEIKKWNAVALWAWGIESQANQGFVTMLSISTVSIDGSKLIEFASWIIRLFEMVEVPEHLEMELEEKTLLELKLLDIIVVHTLMLLVRRMEMALAKMVKSLWTLFETPQLEKMESLVDLELVSGSILGTRTGMTFAALVGFPLYKKTERMI